MGKDYYATLGIPRYADAEAIKKAYRKLAMQFHPDKNPDDVEVAEQKFKLISEAYDVLSDPQKKGVYDQYGEEALKGQPPPNAHAGHHGHAPQQQQHQQTFMFHFKDANELFSQMFGANSPFNLGGDRLFNFTPQFGGSDLASESTADISDPEKGSKPRVVFTYYVSLEELYKGTHKKFNVERQTPQGTSETKLFEFDVHPGWKKGKTITYENEGGILQGHPPDVLGDLVFVMDEKPHEHFERKGDDLKVRCDISVTQALLGTRLLHVTLDGRMLPFEIPACHQPGKKVVVIGEGMPVHNPDRPMAPTAKGNLYIELRIRLPTTLTAEQIQLIQHMNL